MYTDRCPTLILLSIVTLIPIFIKIKYKVFLQQGRRSAKKLSVIRCVFMCGL